MRAVILAGGKGTRLAPYTTVLPKPLMPIGDMPILEVILHQLRRAGFRDVSLAVGHLAELLQAFFGNGEKLGLSIEYSMEDTPLGTAGPLTLIDRLDKPFLVMNGDILTDLDYKDFYDSHCASDAIASIAMYSRDVKIDFGVLDVDDDNQLIDIIEKPTNQYRVSMGIYMFSPGILGYMKKGEQLDFPDLVKTLLEAGEKVRVYPFKGYWLDIGRHSDFAQAVDEFEANRKLFFPDDDQD